MAKLCDSKKDVEQTVQNGAEFQLPLAMQLTHDFVAALGSRQLTPSQGLAALLAVC